MALVRTALLRVEDHLESLLAGSGPVLAVQMPFAEDPGRVTGGFEGIGHGDDRRGKAGLVRDRDQPLESLRAAVGAAHGEHVVARRVGAGMQRGPAGRAVAGRRVGLGKDHAFLHHPVEVRRLVEVAAVVAGVLPAEVVGVDQHDVCRFGEGRRGNEAREEKGEGFHDDSEVSSSAPMIPACWPSAGATRYGVCRTGKWYPAEISPSKAPVFA